MAVIENTAAMRTEPPLAGASWTTRLVVGLSVSLSLALHLAVLGSVLLAHPLPREATAPPSITVDLVRERDLAPQAKPEPPKPPPELPAPEKALQQPASVTQPTPTLVQPQPQPQAPQSTQADTSAADAAATAARIASMLHLSELDPTASFEAPPTDSKARLSSKEIAALKAHLKSCWTPPAGVPPDANLKAVIRIALDPQGRLIREPTLLAGSASVHGPALVKSALQALAQCQPYAMLPAKKYKEWKQLDLGFTSRDILDVNSGTGFVASQPNR